MCYTIKIDLTREALEKRFGASFRDQQPVYPGNRVQAFSLPVLPVICSENPAEIRLFYWGLIPFWVKDARSASEIRTKTFNAKAETLHEKPSFRHSLQRKRCLIPVNGFYEWQTKDKRKIPFYISLVHQPVMSLAGLYDQWKNPETGEVLNSFTIITTRANQMMEEIHNLKKRMPVILSPEAEQSWLMPETDPIKEGFFEPFPQEMMQAENLSEKTIF
jgi:putative SOS response-associated peptidase YedK